LHTNLVGTINCLEAARKRNAAFLFLSTSRVYPIASLNALPFEERDTRFAWTSDTPAAGASPGGISETFTLDGPRSLYGASKLAGEMLLQEYVYNYGMRGLVNRCGLLAGPWQMGKIDQGVVTLWVANHYFNRPLDYIGFGGAGKQVRDILHVEDLFELIIRQLANAHAWDGKVYNVGGGPSLSVSLQELTAKCALLTGNTITIGAVQETSSVDLRIYLTDAAKAIDDFDWQPRRDINTILKDIYLWIRGNETLLKRVLG